MMRFFFFDLDGTLEDSRKDMVAAAQHVRTLLGLPERDFDALVPYVNQGMRELYRNCFDDFVSLVGTQVVDEAKMMQVQRLYEQRYGECIAVETRLYPGIRAALEDAKGLGRTAVITNKPEHLSIRLLECLGVLPLIDLVVGGDTCEEAKPSPIPLQHALRRLGGNPSHDRVFMIGDSQGDARAGSLCGATTVWCAWGYQKHTPTEPAPHHTVQSPENLRDIFRIQ